MGLSDLPIVLLCLVSDFLCTAALSQVCQKAWDALRHRHIRWHVASGDLPAACRRLLLPALRTSLLG